MSKRDPMSGPDVLLSMWTATHLRDTLKRSRMHMSQDEMCAINALCDEIESQWRAEEAREHEEKEQA